MDKKGLSGSQNDVVSEAIAWWARLHSGLAGVQEREAWAAWLAADRAHQQAWERLQSIGASVRRVPVGLAHAALARPAMPGRRSALRSLALAGGTGVLAWCGYRWTPWQRLTADLSTAVGERRELRVAEGIRMVLGSDTAVSVDMAAPSVAIGLLRGEIMVQADGPVLPPQRFLRVDTGYGQVHASRARFEARRGDGMAQVAVYEGGVQLVRARHAGVVDGVAGETLYLDRQGDLRRGPADADLAAWVDGLVVAKNWRLDRFARELERYRVGIIRVSPAVADLRLSGVFPWDDAMRALQTVKHVLPIEVRMHTRYWLQIDPRVV